LEIRMKFGIKGGMKKPVVWEANHGGILQAN
jgi:hypothetical protein